MDRPHRTGQDRPRRIGPPRIEPHRTRQLKHRAKTVCLLAATAILLAGLSWGVISAFASSATPAASPRTILQIGYYQSLDSLNPYIGQQDIAWDIYRLNYDRLVCYDPATLKPIPGLATSWSHSPDGLSWTFHIRHGVTWQDGQPLTARDVAFSFNYVVKNQLSNYLNYATSIKNAVATDDYTVVFHLTQPKATMLETWVPIVPQHIWGSISGTDAANKFQNSSPVIGSGPFQVVQWVKGDYVRLIANKHYWGGAPKIDELIMRMYTNEDTLATDLKQGVIQYADVAPAEFRSFEGRSGLTAHRAVNDWFNDIGFNCYTGPSLGNPVLKDWRFRNALNWAIDRNKIASIACEGAAVPATSLLPSGYWPASLDYHWSPPADQLYRYDPAKANALLTAAGYPLKNGVRLNKQGKPIVLRIYADDEQDAYLTTAKLVAGWLQGIGIKVVVSSLDTGALNADIYNMVGNKFTPNYDLFCWNWDGDPDPNFLLSVLLSSQINGWSDTAYANPTYDRLYLQQSREMDPAKRLQTIHEMEQIVYQQTPYIIAVYPQILQVYDTAHWTGWVNQPAGSGSVDNYWTFLRVAPKGNATSGGTSPLLIVIPLVIAAAIVVGLVAWRVRRRGAVRLEVEG